MKRGVLAAFVAAFIAATPATVLAEVTYTILSFDDLTGWKDDDHQAAIDVFKGTCGDLRKGEWPAVCAMAKSQPNPQVFFELFFRPVLIEDGKAGLFTGYFEPELSGSRTQSFRYRYPLYKKPPELTKGTLWHSRADIENQQLLAGRGLEIAWVDNPVDVFFLQIQGSGRVRLNDGTSIRVGYGGANGHKYRSIGKELVRRGVYKSHQVSAQVIRNWVQRNPIQGKELLQTSPAYVFFRELRGLSPDRGPLGAMNRSLTTNRSLAVDPAYVLLGSPVWVEKGGRDGFRRLMIAQDTGSAIKGAQRGDIFYGTGFEAGRTAGQIHDPGRMVVLMPIETAYASAEGLGK